MKNGAAEYYENVRALWLKDGKIHTASIAYRTTIYSAENGTITCKDADGNIITEEAYNHAAETYFTGFEKKTTSFGWQDMKELAEDVAEITAQLDASYNIYAYSD